MKKIIVSLISILTICIMFVSCNNNKVPEESKIFTDTETVANKENIDDEPFEGGGIAHVPFECEYAMEYYSVGSQFEDLVDDKEAVYEWRIEGGVYGNHGDREVINMETFINRFNIPKEDFKAANLIIGEEYAYYTDAQIEALYSGDRVQIAEQFANPNAIRIGGNIYAPRWIQKHSAAEVAAVGITKDMLESKYDELIEIYPEDTKMCKTFKEKIDAFETLDNTAVKAAKKDYLEPTGGVIRANAEDKYIRPYYSVAVYLFDIVRDDESLKDDWDAWWKESRVAGSVEEFNKDVHNLEEFIRRFNISKEDFKAHNFISENDPTPIYTDEQIEALYSGDRAQIAEQFGNPHAIIVDDKIYTPKWIAEHDAEEIKAAGITEEALEAKYEDWTEQFKADSGLCKTAKANIENLAEIAKADKTAEVS